MRKTRIVLAVLVLFVWASAVDASQQYGGDHFLADMVGEDCVLYFTLPRPPQARQQMYDLQLLGLRKEPEMKALWQELSRKTGGSVEQQFGAGVDELVKRAEGFSDLFDRQISLAVIRGASVEGYHGPFGALTTGLVLGEWVALLESSGPAAEVQKALEQFAAGPVARAIWDGGLKQDKMGSRTAYRSPSGGVPLFLARRGSAVVVASRESLLKDTVRAFEDPPGKALSDSSSFQQTLQQSRDVGASMFMHWDVSKTIDRARQEMDDDELASFDEAMSVFGLDALSAFWRGEGKRARFRIALDPGDRPKTMLNAFKSTQDTLRTAEVVHKEAFVYASGMVSLRRFTDMILEQIEEAEFPGEEPETGPEAEEWAEFKAAREAVKTLSGQMGPEVALYARFPSGGGMVPNAAFLCQVSDPVAVEDDLQSLLKLGKKVEMREIPYLDYTIYTMPQKGAPFGLSYAVLDRNLVLGLTPGAVKEVISTRRKSGSSLRRREEFNSALKPLSENYNGLFYLDTRAAGLFAYNTASSFLSAASQRGRDEMPIDPALLPTADTLGAHLGKSVCIFKKENAEQLIAEGYSAGVDPLTFCGLGILHMPIMGPLMAKNAESGISSACSGTLSRAISMPPEEEVMLPDSQLAFLKEYTRPGVKNLTCPVDLNPTELGEGYETSFVYFPDEFDVKMKWGGRPGPVMGSGGDMPDSEQERQQMMREFRSRREEFILYEDEPRHGGRTVMTRGFGMARSIPEQRFQELLREQKKEYGISDNAGEKSGE